MKHTVPSNKWALPLSVSHVLRLQQQKPSSQVPFCVYHYSAIEVDVAVLLFTVLCKGVVPLFSTHCSCAGTSPEKMWLISLSTERYKMKVKRVFA